MLRKKIFLGILSTTILVACSQQHKNVFNSRSVTDSSDSHEISGELSIAESALSMLDSPINISVVSAKGLVHGYHNAPVELTRSGNNQFFVVVPKRVRAQLTFSSVTVQIDSVQTELQLNIGVDVANLRLIYYLSPKRRF